MSGIHVDVAAPWRRYSCPQAAALGAAHLGGDAGCVVSGSNQVHPQGHRALTSAVIYRPTAGLQPNRFSSVAHYDLVLLAEGTSDYIQWPQSARIERRAGNPGDVY